LIRFRIDLGSSGFPGFFRLYSFPHPECLMLDEMWKMRETEEPVWECTEKIVK